MGLDIVDIVDAWLRAGRSSIIIIERIRLEPSNQSHITLIKKQEEEKRKNSQPGKSLTCLPVPIVVTTNLSLSMESKSLANATLAQRNGP